MYNYLKRTWAEIDLDCISHNVKSIRSLLAPDCKLLGVVKADAYGHGDKTVALQMQQDGVDWFGISNVEEGVGLGEAGITGPILIFGATPVEWVETLAKYRITQALFSPEYAVQLSQAAVEARVQVDVHVKVDTGMTRIGFPCTGGIDKAAEQIAAACCLPHLHPTGIFTHFAVSDELSDGSVEYTERQFSQFMAVVEALEGRGITFPLRHCCNSAGTLNWPAFHLDMVRPGIILYGIAPCKNERIPLRPAMRLKTVVTLVKTVAPGEFVSYGNTYETQRPTRIATLAVGYADGYQRALSSKGSVVLHGQVAPVLGRVCMDQMMVDVSHSPGVCRGDEAILFGAEEDGLTAAQLAETCGTIPYELTCILGRRVQRIYLRGGQVVDVLDYIC